MPSKHLLMTCKTRYMKILFVFFIRSVIGLQSAIEKHGKGKTYWLFLCQWRYPCSSVCRNCLLSCFLLCRRMPHKAQLLECMNNKRKHAMHANACVCTRFLTCICAKVVRAFCVSVGRLSLTCTVYSFTFKVQMLYFTKGSYCNTISIAVSIITTVEHPSYLTISKQLSQKRFEFPYLKDVRAKIF